jgi:predicted dehydrogenase
LLLLPLGVTKPTILTVGVVGCGIGRNHIAQGYSSHPDKFRVLAVCDIDEMRLAAVADEFLVPRRIRCFDDLLRMDDIDIVDICTPAGLHCEQILAALSAGKQVVCEKPLVGSLAEIDKVIAAEKTAAGRVMPIFQYRFADGVQKAKRIVDLRIAGEPYLATVETAWRRTAKYYETPWRGRRATERGGVLLMHAIHAHDLMTWLMGPVASVFSRIATRVNRIEVEDCAVASLTMRSGALVSLAATLGSLREISRLRLCYEHVTFQSSLAPYSPGDDPWEIVPSSPETGQCIAEALADHQPVQPRYAGQFGAYHTALTTGAALPVTLADARISLELVTALYHSAVTGTAVTLPIEPHHPSHGGWLIGEG